MYYSIPHFYTSCPPLCTSYPILAFPAPLLASPTPLFACPAPFFTYDILRLWPCLSLPPFPLPPWLQESSNLDSFSNQGPKILKPCLNNTFISPMVFERFSLNLAKIWVILWTSAWSKMLVNPASKLQRVRSKPPIRSKPLIHFFGSGDRQVVGWGQHLRTWGLCSPFFFYIFCLHSTMS